MMKRYLISGMLFLLAVCGNNISIAQSGNVGIGTATPGSKLTVAGSMAFGYTATTSTAYTVLDNDYYISWTGAANGTATLPATAAAKQGRVYKFKNNTAAFTLTIASSGGVTIDGANSIAVPPGYGVEVIANGNTSGTSWEVVAAGSLSSTASTAGTSIGTLGGTGGTCTPTPAVGGGFTATVSPTTQSVTVTVNVTQPGNYSIVTNSVNGLSFSGSGYFSATGVQTVLLFPRGTPTAGGNPTYTLSYGGTTCSFTVNNITGFTCGSATKTQSPAGNIVSSTAYTGSYTLPYTTGNGLGYPSATQTINGLTLTRVAGTFTLGGSGNVVYNLSGTATAPGNVTFVIPECSATVTFGDAIRESLIAAGCASCVAYDAAAVDTWVPVTATEYAALASTANVSGATKVGASDGIMNAPGAAFAFNGGGSTFTFGGVTAHTTAAPSTYIIGYTWKTSPATGSVNNGTCTGHKLKFGTTPNSGYAQYASTFPSFTVAPGTQYYFVCKRSSTTSPASTGYMGILNNNNGIGDPGTTSSSTTYYLPGDVSSLTTFSSPVQMQFQCIGTTYKQW